MSDISKDGQDYLANYWNNPENAEEGVDILEAGVSDLADLTPYRNILKKRNQDVPDHVLRQAVSDIRREYLDKTFHWDKVTPYEAARFSEDLCLVLKTLMNTKDQAGKRVIPNDKDNRLWATTVLSQITRVLEDENKEMTTKVVDHAANMEDLEFLEQDREDVYHTAELLRLPSPNMDELLTLIRQNLKQPGNEVSKRKQEEYVATNREQLLEETKNSVETYREQAQLHMEQHLPQGHFKKLKVWLKGAASYVSLARKRPDIAKEILATAAGFVLTATGAATTNIDTTLIGLTVAGFGMYASVKANEKRELPVEGNIGEDFGAPTGKEGKRVGDYYKALNVNIKRREKEAKAHPTHEH